MWHEKRLHTPCSFFPVTFLSSIIPNIKLALLVNHYPHYCCYKQQCPPINYYHLLASFVFNQSWRGFLSSFLRPIQSWLLPSAVLLQLRSSAQSPCFPLSYFNVLTVLFPDTQEVNLRLIFLIIVRRKSAKLKIRYIKLPKNYYINKADPGKAEFIFF